MLARELGVKWDFRAAGIAGRLNADVYHYSYTDIQQNFSGTFNNLGFFYTANIAAATHQGFEMSATFIPSLAWDIRAAYNYNDFHYTKWTGQDPYALLNLRATWSNKDGRWGAGVFLNNAGNEVYKLGTTAQVLSLGFGTASYGPPRMFGVELTRKF